MNLNEIHREIGMGRQKFVMPQALKLHGVELKVIHNLKTLLHENEPVYQEFPALNAPNFVPREKIGDTEIEFKTSRGKLRIKYTITESMVANKGAEPYLTEHLIKEDSDYEIAEYILERSEIINRFDMIAEAESEVGENGFVVPRIHRIPFQQALLEYLGEIPLFTALYKNKDRLNRLITVIDEQMTEMVRLYAESDALVVQSPDNLDGFMTNPNLFKEYCLPQYQKYSTMLHTQNKKMCSHTDGNLKPIANLLPESGLDIFEAFSPSPLTELTIDEALDTWRDSAMIWGGIPSTILEETTDDDSFVNWVDSYFNSIDKNATIVGIGDQVMPESQIERVKYIAKIVKAIAL